MHPPGGIRELFRVRSAGLRDLRNPVQHPDPTLFCGLLPGLKIDSETHRSATAQAHDLLKQGAIGGGIGFLSRMVGIGRRIF